MIKKLTKIAMAFAIAFTAVAATAPDADARRGRNLALGITAGIVTLGILGTYANRPYYAPHPNYYYSASPHCYKGPERCGWVGRRCWENSYGELICKGGVWRCHRPTYCD
jgi:hypothetical protein